jgi:hypothetical protein
MAHSSASRMNEAEQNAYLLNLVKALSQELGVYLTFAEVVKMIVGEGDVNEMLAKVRRDPDLVSHVETYFQFLSATLSASGAMDPEIALQAFLSQWNTRGRPN